MGGRRSSRLWVRFGRYSIGSVIALASSELVFVVCFGSAGLGPTGSAVAAFVAGAIPNYVINRYWAWGRRGRLRVAREVVLYLAIILGSLVVSIVATGGADDLAKHLTGTHAARTVVVSAAYLGIQGVLFLVKFALFQTVIFTDPDLHRPGSSRTAGDVTGTVARARTWSARPVAPAVIAFVASVTFTVERLIVVAHGQASRLVMAERRYANPARVPRGLVVLVNNGYDGQFFYRLALNPSNLHRTAYGITFDSNFRVQRIGYPALAWLVSFGQHQWVPAALVIVNVAALTGIGLVGGMLAREANRHPLWGLLLAGYFGFVFSLGRDLAEPTAAVFFLAGVLAYRRRRPVLAGVLLACGALTRETVMVFVAAIAIVKVVSVLRRRVRPGRDDLAWLLPSAVFAGWQGVTFAVTGNFALGADTSSNTGLPGQAMIHGAATHISHISIHAAAIDAWVVEFVVLVALVVLAAASLRSTTAPAPERLAFVLFVVELFVLSPGIWNGVADLRSLDEVYLFAILILMGARRRLVVPALVACPALLVVVAHRAVSL